MIADEANCGACRRRVEGRCHVPPGCAPCCVLLDVPSVGAGASVREPGEPAAGQEASHHAGPCGGVCALLAEALTAAEHERLTAQTQEEWCAALEAELATRATAAEGERDGLRRLLAERDEELAALIGTITRSLGPHIQEDPESVGYVHPGDPPAMAANNTVVWAARQLSAVAFARQQGGALHYQRLWEDAVQAALSQKLRADAAEAELARLRGVGGPGGPGAGGR